MSPAKRFPHGTIALPSLAGEGDGMGAKRPYRLDALTPALSRMREREHKQG